MSNPDHIFQELHRGLSEKCYLDAELLVGQNGVITFHHAVGDHATQPQAVFDLASLTKPLCTATLCMSLCDQGKLSADDPVEKYFPTTNLKGVQLKELLNHTSGLKGWAPLYKEFMPDKIDHTKNLARMTDRLLNDNTLLNNKRGTTEYSCLGYILLTAIFEKVGDAPLNKLFNDLSDQSDPTNQLFFPTTNCQLPTANFIPSAFCPTRNRINVGEVNDLNAYALGGVSGNAGLFGSATAVHNALIELRRAKLGQSKLISANTFNLFCQPPTINHQPSTDFYTPGFNTPTPGASQSGTHFSPNTIGHLSHTGCSFWWDLDKDFWVILLTNRHMSDPTNERFKIFRPALHDIIFEKLSDLSVLGG